MGHDFDHGTPFDSSATGWLLRLLFFPSGVISLLLIVLLVKRSSYTPNEEERLVKKAGRQRIPSQGSLRALNEDEVQKVVVEYVLSKRRQQELEKSGAIDERSCGFCMGSGKRKAYVQLPCGHFHHAWCLKTALQQDVATCPDCGWSIKSLFDIEPRVPGMDADGGF